MAITSVNELWGKRWQLKKEPTLPDATIKLYVTNYSSGVYPATWIYNINDDRKSMANANNGLFMEISSNFITLEVSMDIYSSYDGWNQTYSSDYPRVLDFIEQPSDNSFIENADFVTWWNANATEYTVANEFKSLFDEIADAIREKDGTTAVMGARYFPSRIRAIEDGGITPEGTLTITTNGTYDVTTYATAEVEVDGGGGITPEGTIAITSNGDHDVTNYATASVNVPVPEGYIIPEGTIEITENTTTDVTNYATVVTNVPNVIPEGYIKPEGTLEITANGDYDAAEYASVSVAVEGGGSSGPSFADYVAIKDASSLQYLFSGSTATNLDSYISCLDTSNTSNMTSMFDSCENLVSVAYFNTSKVSNATYMFNQAKNLENIFDISLANDARANSMFNNCQKLQSVKISAGTYGFSNISYMFRDCYNLKTIDLDSLENVTSTYSSSSAFAACRSLTKLIIRKMTKAPAINTNTFSNCYHFDGTVSSTYNPDGLKDGRIYVPDEMVDTLKAATNWSTYADFIVPLSTLEE